MRLTVSIRNLNVNLRKGGYSMKDFSITGTLIMVAIVVVAVIVGNWVTTKINKTA